MLLTKTSLVLSQVPESVDIFFEIALHRVDNNVQSQSSQSAAEKRNHLCLFPDSDVSVTKKFRNKNKNSKVLTIFVLIVCSRSSKNFYEVEKASFSSKIVIDSKFFRGNVKRKNSTKSEKRLKNLICSQRTLGND